MKEIQLTKGFVALIDDEDFDRVSKYKWCACVSGSAVYALHSFKSDLTGKRFVLSMHRFIMDNPDGLEVDHINHNGIDNRKENLRACTGSQNSMNSSIYKNNTTEYKGTSYNPKNNPSNPYSAHIGYQGKLIHLGYYTTVQQAARAYDRKAKELFGEFAALNYDD